MSLTYKTFGARGYTCQIDRIDQGFRELGLQESRFPDFIYCNDLGCFDEAYKFRKEQCQSSIFIQNVLDLPIWCRDVNLNKIYEQLIHTDKITCISKFVQGQIKHFFNLDSEVIYNPAKNINSQLRDSEIKKYPQYKYMMVGRLRDESKRAGIAINALNLIEGTSRLAVVGSENIGCGDYLGIVEDEKLNDLYNSVDYVFMTSAQEGLGLPGVEAILGGAIPIICHDLSTFSEFYPQHWGCYPSAEAIANRIYLLENNKEIKNQLLQEIKQLQPEIFKKLDYLEVANRIINFAK